MNRQLTVIQLIEQLQRFPSDWNVYFDQTSEHGDIVGQIEVEQAYCGGQGEVIIGIIGNNIYK